MHQEIGDFYTEGVLSGEWHVRNQSQLVANSGWSGHLVQTNSNQQGSGQGSGQGSSSGSGDPNDPNGESSASNDGPPAPPVVTNTYHTFDQFTWQHASGQENFDSTFGIYGRQARDIEVGGEIIEFGQTTFEISEFSSNKSEEGRKYRKLSQRNVSADDGYGWIYLGGGTGNRTNELYDITYSTGVTIEEGGGRWREELFHYHRRIRLEPPRNDDAFV